MANETKVTTPEFRLSFPHIFEPQENDRGEKKYGISMLFKKGEDLSALKAAAKAATIAKWGADPAKWPKNLRNPFRDQGEKDFDGYVDGAVFVNATSKQRPGVVDQQLQHIVDSSEVYAGCYCRASINAFAYDTAGNKGVAFGLNNIQKLRDGERLDGRTKPENDFTPVEMPADSDAGAVFDSAAGDDADPFA